MNTLLERLGVPLKAVWCPDPEQKQHAYIDLENQLLILYDESEDEAWRSLFHECLEYRIRSVISPYREIVNSLITLIEKIVYAEKERALAEILNDFQVWSIEAKRPRSTNDKARGVTKESIHAGS